MVVQRLVIEKWGRKTHGIYVSYGSLIVLLLLAAVALAAVAGFGAQRLTERVRNKALAEAARERVERQAAAPEPMPSGPRMDPFLSASSEQELRVLLAAGDNEAALDFIARKTLSAPDSWKLHLYKAQALMALQRIEEAGRELEFASRVSPGNTDVLLAVAGYHMALGRVFTAEKFYFEAIKAAPQEPGAYRSLALLYLRATMFARAEALARRGVEVAPDDLNLRMSLAVALFRQARYEDALAQFRKYRLQGGEDTVTLCLYMGDCLERMEGAEEQALKEYDAALALDPDSVQAANNKALLLARMGRTQEALGVIDGLLARGERDAYVLDSAGWIRVLADDLDGALPLFSEALDKEPGHPEILAHAAALHRRAGRSEQAGRLYDKAIDAARGNPVAERKVRDVYGSAPERTGETHKQ